MNKEEITAKVLETISERLEIDEAQLAPKTRFSEDLKADSLALMELVLAFEETFDLQTNDEEAEKLKTVQDAIDLVAAQLTQ
jgi:acyl carrier protein